MDCVVVGTVSSIEGTGYLAGVLLWEIKAFLIVMGMGGPRLTACAGAKSYSETC